MSDLHRAMAEIDAIRGHIARNTEFRGYGPAAVATTGAFALAAAALQSQWLPDPQHSLGAYLALWVATAVLSMVLIGIETVTRSVRVHRGLAKEMLHAAAEQFVPAISAGGLLAVELSLLAGATILLSWFFAHTAFAVHYAHDYYADLAAEHPPGLIFPGGRADPDY